MTMKKSVLFVDDEPNVLQGLKRILRNMRGEWEMFFVESGKEALGFLSDNNVDIIITDIRMPVMDGAELLGEVMNRYPHIVRIILSGHSDKDMILRSAKSAHQFLAKPCDAETLKQTIERAYISRKFLKNESLLKLITGIKRVPSSPAIYNRIIMEIQSPRASLKSVGDIIAKDVAMTARVLQLVNSAFFSLPQKVVSPQHAVAMLGFDIIKAIVLYVELFSAFGTANNTLLRDLWKHSIMVGDLSKEIAQSELSNRVVSDDAFIAGILHDIGKLLLMEIPGCFSRIRAAMNNNECNFLEAEYQLLGTSHAEVGAYLLGIWGLPEPIIEAVAFHHRPDMLKESKFSCISAVYIANALIKKNNTSGKNDHIDTGYLEALKLTEKLDRWVQKCKKIMEKEYSI